MGGNRIDQMTGLLYVPKLDLAGALLGQKDGVTVIGMLVLYTYTISQPGLSMQTPALGKAYDRSLNNDQYRAPLLPGNMVPV